MVDPGLGRSGCESASWGMACLQGLQRSVRLKFLQGLALLVMPILSAPVSVAYAYPSLQPLIDKADPKGTLVPPPGIYSGPVTIKSPLTLDGKGKVTIDAAGKGSVIYLKTDGATLMNLHLRNSGESHNDLDSGVQVRGDFNVLKGLEITNTLFGIDLKQSSNNIVKQNHITPRSFPLGIRGDAIRLWYSFGNQVTDNVIRNARDDVVWYSKDNLIARNDVRGGRYALHFMYSKHNEVIDNHFEHNAVGVFLMYSDGVVLRRNTIAYSNGVTGMGVGFKESSDVELTNNQILHCAKGVYLDVSPYQPGTTNRFRNNVIAYSNIGILFLNDWQGNILTGNSFKGNITQVAVSGRGKTANRNVWKGNYWDDYRGFDQDGNGIGDKPYELYSYADRIWLDVPPAQFFQGTPVLEVIDFLERLAPFNKPNMLVRDERPLMLAETAEISPLATPKQSAPTPSVGGVKSGKPPAFDAYKALLDSLGRNPGGNEP